jgi:hypothetical protein
MIVWTIVVGVVAILWRTHDKKKEIGRRNRVVDGGGTANEEGVHEHFLDRGPKEIIRSSIYVFCILI